MKNLLNLKGVTTLSRKQQQSVFGGMVSEVSCKCNGHPIGTADSAMGCAARCSGCVSNGGCE